MRELRPGVTNDKTSLFNAQFNKNATTNGAYVVLFGKALFKFFDIDYSNDCNKRQ